MKDAARATSLLREPCPRSTEWRGPPICSQAPADLAARPGRPVRGPPRLRAALITRGTIAVKARLLDQSKIAGVGNLLADEILWQARVSPLARVDTLSPAQVRRLYRALKSVLESARAKGGAHTGQIIAARHPGGTCPRDGAPMVHGTVGGRSTWWCSREQATPPAEAGQRH